ncbi:MAG TPA: basic secretory protein-like protein [Chitinophagaceae bacterium]|nr:basic secretory protein-like protein [Chitinophagaceae bacterium]
MKTTSIITFLCLFFLFNTQTTQAQPHHSWSDYDTTGFYTHKIITKKGYALTFIHLDSTFNTKEILRLIHTFFKVYPKEVKAFNRSSTPKVTFIIDPEYKGVAATSGGTTRFNPEWFKSHPEDIDVVTHEVMHIVQSYHFGHVPGWLTEGIADYVRYIYGVNNKGADWTLPDYNSKQNFDDAYRITARFLVWVTKNGHHAIVKKLDNALRNGTYHKNLWEKLTGKTVEQLWQDYTKNPELKLKYK